MSEINEITPQKLYEKFLAGEIPNIIDVRNPSSFKDWSIFSSTNIPFSKILEFEDKSKLQIDGPVITVCSKGNDSKIIAKNLIDLGIPAISLKGGIREWNNVFNIVSILSSKSYEVFQFQRIAKGCLSYMVINGDEAVVFDPSYNIDAYVNLAKKKNVSITKVYETHLHVDHIAGGKRLADQCDAKLYLSNDDPFTFEHNSIIHNKKVNVGGLNLITPISTPGHTKGSTSFRIGKEFMLVGDTIFVDSIGRPDLAEKAEIFAKDLFLTVKNVFSLEEQDILFGPAHQGTIGLEHLKKPITLKKSDLAKFKQFSFTEEEFIKYAVTSAQKTQKPPSYETVFNINSGKLDINNFDVLDLEIGPNRCAIN
jgi:glyoxylase-like metal-dependent hydrolase (beta-lactamase superfamily II)/rhodanese-related sulfurtransferase